MMKGVVVLLLCVAATAHAARLTETSSDLRDLDETVFAAVPHDDKVDSTSDSVASTSLLQDAAVSYEKVASQAEQWRKNDEAEAEALAARLKERRQRQADLDLGAAAARAGNVRKLDEMIEGHLASMFPKTGRALSLSSKQRLYNLKLASAMRDTSDLGAGRPGSALVNSLLGSSLRMTSKGLQIENDPKKEAEYKAMHPQPREFNATGSGLNATQASELASKEMKPAPLPPTDSLIPLLRFFAETKEDHAGTTDPFEYAQRLGIWEFQGVVALVWGRRENASAAGPDEALVPFYRFWDRAADDHFFSLNADATGVPVPVQDRNATNATTETQQIAEGETIRQGISGFIYNVQRPGLVALNEYYSTELKDHLYSIAEGKTLALNGRAYAFKQVLGYVHPLVSEEPSDSGSNAAAGSASGSSNAADASGSSDGADAGEDHGAAGVEEGRKWFPGMPLHITGEDISR